MIYWRNVKPNGEEVVVVPEQSYLLTLGLPGVPAGEIDFRNLVGLADALQLTATRIGRQIGQIEGPGRADRGIDTASSLRLRGLKKGSTGIDFVLGDPNAFSEMIDEEQIK